MSGEGWDEGLFVMMRRYLRPPVLKLDLPHFVLDEYRLLIDGWYTTLQEH